MKRTPFLMLLCGFFLGIAVTSITQEQLQRRWRQQDIEDAIALNLMSEIAPGEFGADLPVTRGELARILVEARPHLRGIQGPPGPQGPPGMPVMPGARAPTRQPGAGATPMPVQPPQPDAGRGPERYVMTLDGTLTRFVEPNEVYVTPTGIVLAPGGTAFGSLQVYRQYVEWAGTSLRRVQRYPRGLDEQMLRTGAVARVPGGVYFRSLQDYCDYVQWHKGGQFPLRRDVGTVRQELASIESSVSSLRSGYSGLDDEISSLRSGMSDLSRDISDVQSSVSSFDRNISDVRDDIREIERDVDRIDP